MSEETVEGPKTTLPNINILDLLSGDHRKRCDALIKAIVDHKINTASIEDLRDWARSDLISYYESDLVPLREIEEDFNNIYGDILNG